MPSLHHSACVYVCVCPHMQACVCVCLGERVAYIAASAPAVWAMWRRMFRRGQELAAGWGKEGVQRGVCEGPDPRSCLSSLLRWAGRAPALAGRQETKNKGSACASIKSDEHISNKENTPTTNTTPPTHLDRAAHRRLQLPRVVRAPARVHPGTRAAC